MATEDVLTAALTYAGRGWRVLPIRPGEKRPPMEAWQEAATTDGSLIRQWWRQWPRHGVGIATGQRSGLFVVDVDVSDGKHGDDTLADLEATYEPLPSTVEVVTGSGGRHLYFRWPEGLDIRNDAGTRLGPGLDVRGEGGQVLAPPTCHPNGTAYAWEASSHPDDTDVAEAPGWLLALLTAAPATEPRAERAPYVGDPRPGDLFAAAVTWPDLLRADGATFLGERVDHRLGHRYELWARPGVDDHAGATLYYGGSDLLKVFSSNWPGLAPDQTYTRFGYFVATRYHGDFARAAGDLRARQSVEEVERWALIESAPATPAQGEPGAAEEPSATLAVRWVDVLDGKMPPEPPEIIEGMLRAGEFCVIGAPRAVGKTWIGMNVAVLLSEGEGKLFGQLEVKRRARVLYLQGELDEWGSASRWKDLTGIAHPLPHVAETFERLRFRVVQRRATSTQDGQTTSDEWLDATIPPMLEATIVAEGIEVVIVDPWAVYQGGAENSNDQAEAILGRLREITLRTGVAWLVLHHVGKGTDVREPEDLWRGASRLADWASTRITLMPHYTEAKRKQLQLERWEARRYVDVYFLRRSTPTPDFSMHLNPEGWWEHWEAPDDEDEEMDMGGRPPQYRVRDLVQALEREGGSITGITRIADRIGCSRDPASRLVSDAESAGVVSVDRPGGTRPIVVTLAVVGNPSSLAGNLLSDPLSETPDKRFPTSETPGQSACRGFPSTETTNKHSEQDICHVGNPPLPTGGGLQGVGPVPVGVDGEPYEGLI